MPRPGIHAAGIGGSSPMGYRVAGSNPAVPDHSKSQDGSRGRPRGSHDGVGCSLVGEKRRLIHSRDVSLDPFRRLERVVEQEADGASRRE